MTYLTVQNNGSVSFVFSAVLILVWGLAREAFILFLAHGIRLDRVHFVSWSIGLSTLYKSLSRIWNSVVSETSISLSKKIIPYESAVNVAQCLGAIWIRLFQKNLHFGFKLDAFSNYSWYIINENESTLLDTNCHPNGFFFFFWF